MISICWDIIRKNKECDVHEVSKKCAEGVVCAAMDRKATDNLTCLFIALPNLEKYLKSA